MQHCRHGMPAPSPSSSHALPTAAVRSRVCQTPNELLFSGSSSQTKPTSWHGWRSTMPAKRGCCTSPRCARCRLLTGQHADPCACAIGINASSSVFGSSASGRANQLRHLEIPTRNIAIGKLEGRNPSVDVVNLPAIRCFFCTTVYGFRS